MDADRELFEIRKQIEALHLTFAQMQSSILWRYPNPMPAPRADHAACDASIRAYEKPFVTVGRPSTVVPVYPGRRLEPDPSIDPMQYDAAMKR